MANRLTIEEVRKVFEDSGCVLLSNKYVNNRTPLEYVCGCGNTSKIRLDDFKKGKRCKICGVEKRVADRKHDYEFIKQVFEDYGCTLLSKDYKNVNTSLEYICSCGNLSNVRFRDFIRGTRCKNCGLDKIKSKLCHDYEYVANIFEENGCKLLETQYINALTPMEYICKCGVTSKICFNNFIHGNRCKNCGVEKISGENNYNYNPDLTIEERILKRNYEAYNVWRIAVFTRDMHICQCCGTIGGSLVAHHLDGYNWCIERRTDVTNGITLCKDCHTDFHLSNGYGDNTEIQFNEWVQNKRKQDA